MLVALTLAAAATLAWFTSARQTDVSFIELQAVSVSDVSAKLFHYVGETAGTVDGFEPVTDLVIQKFLPGQTERYKLVLENHAAGDFTANIDFLDFNTEGLPDGGMPLCEVMTLQTLSAGTLIAGETLSETGTFQQLFEKTSAAEGNASFLFARNLTVPAKGKRELVFDIGLPADTPNAYQNLAVKLRAIQLQITAKE